MPIYREDSVYTGTTVIYYRRKFRSAQVICKSRVIACAKTRVIACAKTRVIV